MKGIIVLLSLLLFVSCINRPGSTNQNTPGKDSIAIEKADAALAIVEDAVHTSQSVKERYIDSISFGQSYRMTLTLIEQAEGDCFVHFRFDKFEEQAWINRQDLTMDKDPITGLDVVISDFNQDGYNDFSFPNGIAARGANELRTHFLFDPQREEMTLIKNSNEYPNLRFNADLDCFDAWLIYGGSSTLFLRLEQDSLIVFAGVDCHEVVTAYTINKEQERRIISTDTLRGEDAHRRYVNYQPLVEWGN